MRSLSSILFPVVLALLFIASPTVQAGNAVEDSSAPGVPLNLVVNRGQAPDAVRYYAPALDRSVYFLDRGLAITIHHPETPWGLHVDFPGADPGVRVEGREPKECVMSYFRGKPEEWIHSVPTCGEVVYTGLWPGVDMTWNAGTTGLKYAFRVAPGADPSRVRMTWRGATRVETDAAGGLSIVTPSGVIEDERPLAWQVIDGARKTVDIRFAVGEPAADGAVTVSFELGAYDPGVELILDPAVILHCSYVGGNNNEYMNAVVLDTKGQAYVVGDTYSSETVFPVLVGPQLVHNGQRDAFVAKILKDGSAAVYCGYIGGDKLDYGVAIDVDTQGCAYVTGRTISDETTFPVCVGPDLTFNNPGNNRTDAWVAKVAADGSALLFCGYIGGNYEDEGNAIDLDPAGRVYVAGSTKSSPSYGFPVLGGPDLTFNGNYDGFVARITADGTTLEYCGYIGGFTNDYITGVASDGMGNAYVGGYTYSDEGTFPVLVGPDLTHNAQSDAFVAKVIPDGTALLWCGYIGGVGKDEAYGLDLDPQGRIYLAGSTESDETTFPVTVGPDLTHNGSWDAFVTRVRPDGVSLEYCGYLGGISGDSAKDVAVDNGGHAYIAGDTHSTESEGFPVLRGPDYTHNGAYDVFVAQLVPDGSGLIYSGFLGGNHRRSRHGHRRDELRPRDLRGGLHGIQGRFLPRGGAASTRPTTAPATPSWPGSRWRTSRTSPRTRPPSRRPRADRSTSIWPRAAPTRVGTT